MLPFKIMPTEVWVWPNPSDVGSSFRCIRAIYASERGVDGNLLEGGVRKVNIGICWPGSGELQGEKVSHAENFVKAINQAISIAATIQHTQMQGYQHE